MRDPTSSPRLMSIPIKEMPRGATLGAFAGCCSEPLGTTALSSPIAKEGSARKIGSVKIADPGF